MVSEIIHQDPRDLGMALSMDLGTISLKIWNNTENAIQSQQNFVNDHQFLATVKNLSFRLYKLVFETKLTLTMGSFKVAETERLNDDILMNEEGQNLFEVAIDIYDIYSPNIEDSEILVHLKLGKIFLLYEPNTINQILKFFRNTRSQAKQDIESFKLALMNDEIVGDKAEYSGGHALPN